MHCSALSLWTHPERSQKIGRRTDVCMKSCSHTLSGSLQNHDMEILTCPLLFSIAMLDLVVCYKCKAASVKLFIISYGDKQDRICGLIFLQFSL